MRTHISQELSEAQFAEFAQTHPQASWLQTVDKSHQDALRGAGESVYAGVFEQDEQMTRPQLVGAARMLISKTSGGAYAAVPGGAC